MHFSVLRLGVILYELGTMLMLLLSFLVGYVFVTWLDILMVNMCILLFIYFYHIFVAWLEGGSGLHMC